MNEIIVTTRSFCIIRYMYSCAFMNEICHEKSAYLGGGGVSRFASLSAGHCNKSNFRSYHCELVFLEQLQCVADII